MKEILKLSDIRDIPVSFTLGSYDGLHSGHAELLKELKRSSAERKTRSLVISFDPHPRKVVDEGYDMRLLNTKEEKTAIIRSYGIDLLHFINFTKQFSGIGYGDFYREYIFGNLKVKNIIAGTNHMFGRDRAGNNSLLSGLCAEFGAELTSIPPLEYAGRTISSTRIRKALAEGMVEDASAMLGYDYSVTGKVIKGKGLGSRLGFATANMDILGTEKVIPASGVYLTSAAFDGELHYGVSNIGCNPTTDGGSLHMETHIFDICPGLYGKYITVAFIKKLREETAFRTTDELSSAVKNDILEGKEFLKSAGRRPAE